jgi:fructose-1,6-bisphosphatase
MLLVDYGGLDEGGIPQDSSSTVTLAHNVQAAQFTLAGTSVQMILSLDDGSQVLTVASTAVRHNE